MSNRNTVRADNLVFPERAPPLNVILPARWQDAPIPSREWIVQGLIPRGSVTMLGGDGGLGKSLLTLQLLVAMALGRDWLGRQTARPRETCCVLGVYCEDDRDELHRRLADILRHEGADFADLAGLRLVSRVGMDNTLVDFDRWLDRDETRQPTALFSQILNTAIDIGAELVVLDSLHDLFVGNENNRGQARTFINLLREIAIEIQGAVVLTAHPSQSGLRDGTGLSGSTAWNNTVRSRLYLTRPRTDEDDEDRDDSRRVLRTVKANYGKAGEHIELQWQAGVFVPVAAPGRTIAGVVDRLTIDSALLAGLRELVAKGVQVSAAPNKPTGFANVVRKTVSACKSYNAAQCRAAQDRLTAAGKLVQVELGPPSKRRIFVRPVDMTYPGEAVSTPLVNGCGATA